MMSCRVFRSLSDQDARHRCGAGLFHNNLSIQRILITYGLRTEKLQQHPRHSSEAN